MQIRLTLRMDSNVACAVDRISRLAVFGGKSNQRKGQALFGLRDETVHTPAINQIFEPRLLAICAVSVFGEHTNHGGGNCHRLFRGQKQATIRGELLVPRDSAKQDAEVHACWNISTFTNSRGNETDVVCVRNNADGPAVVEGDVELARQSVQ